MSEAAQAFLSIYLIGALISWPFIARALWEGVGPTNSDQDRATALLLGLVCSVVWPGFALVRVCRPLIRWWLP